MAQPGTPVTLSGKGDLPATFIIRDAEGGAGVLQITRLRRSAAGAAHSLQAVGDGGAADRGALVAGYDSCRYGRGFSATAGPCRCDGGADTPEGVLAAVHGATGAGVGGVS
ncbi:hypothetical protein HS125_01670 [bacterium]|nr:hypothetical protein [bacterium]